MTSHSSQQSRTAAQSAVFTAVIAFSWGFIIIKSLEITAPVIAMWRLLAGGILITAISLTLRSSWKELRSPLILVAGLAFGAHQLLYIGAARLTSISLVTTIGATLPITIALLSAPFIKEKVPKRFYLFAVFAVVGVAIIVTANQHTKSFSWLGTILAIINVFAFAGYFLCAKRFRMQNANTFSLTAAVLFISLLVAFPVVFYVSQGESPARIIPTESETWLLAILILGPANGHLFLNWAHSRVSVAFSSLCLSLVPPIASLWAYLILDEAFTSMHVLGMFIVVLSVEGGRRLENAKIE